MFRMVDVIQKKRRGLELSKEEIEFVVEGYTKGEIPDYQMSALLMAICFQGMSERETADLTRSMADSGERIDLSSISGVKVDKHSTGGVGDKTSLIVAPLAAAAGVPVAKMSGRGLGFTGGTIDKLESIPGFRVELSREQFLSNVNRFKLALAGQSGNLAPADKKIYALRDVTATVESIPLIASSIMSKKIASGADCIVLDVKTGNGAFMKSLEEAEQLARSMVNIGKTLNRTTVAVITDMSQPLGHEVGNANEVREAIEVLRGGGPDDLVFISLTLAAHMSVLAKVFRTYEEAFERLEEMLKSGRALEKFRQFVEAQGGNPGVADNPDLLPQARYHTEVKAEHDGYVGAIDAEKVGLAAMMLGAGRKKKEDRIDHAAGVTMKKKIGQRINAGETIAVLHSNDPDVTAVKNMLVQAVQIRPTAPPPIRLVHKTVT